MRNETPVTVVGTVVRNEDKRRVGDDQRMVLNLRVAANERRFDRASQQWVDGDTLYLRVNCWRALAENAGVLLVGDPVIVTGKLRTKEWLTEEGDRRSRVELEASALGPDLARCGVSGVRKTRRDDRTGDDGEAAMDGAEIERGGLADIDAAAGRAELVDAARPLAPAGG